MTMTSGANWARTRRNAWPRWRPEFGKDCGSIGIAGRGGGDGRHLAKDAGALLVIAADGPGGESIFDDASLIGEVPDFSAGRDAGAFGDNVSIDGEGGPDSCAEGDADSPRDAAGGTGSNFSEEKGVGIVEEADLLRLPAEALGKELAETHSIEIGELVAHLADAGLVIEGAWHGQFRAEDLAGLAGCLLAEGVEDLNEGIRSLFGGMRGGDDGAKPIGIFVADGGGNVASPHVVNQDRLCESAVTRTSKDGRLIALSSLPMIAIGKGLLHRDLGNSPFL